MEGVLVAVFVETTIGKRKNVTFECFEELKVLGLFFRDFFNEF
jgi:hypothetical protein